MFGGEVMCAICDGATREEMVERDLDRIDRDGFCLVGVEAEVPWVYTIGLRWTMDLPEMAVVGWPIETACAVIHRVVETGRDEPDSIRPGAHLTIGDGEVHVGRVAPENLAGEWFSWWPEIARAAGRGTLALRAVQLQPECSGRCLEPHDLLDDALERRRTPRALARARRTRMCTRQ